MRHFPFDPMTQLGEYTTADLAPFAALWRLAESVAVLTTAGDQGPIEIILGGCTHDADRAVTVRRDGVEWTGPVGTWQAALREAALRPSWPGEGWVMGPFETVGTEVQS